MSRSRNMANLASGISSRTTRPNLIINGDFQVWQRSDNAYAGGNDYVSADRWHATRLRIRKPNTNGASGEDSRGAVFDCSDGNVYAHVDYILENVDNRLNGKQAVFTFEAKSLTGSSFSLYMEQTGTSYFDRGGSGNVAIGTDWTKITYTGSIVTSGSSNITVARWYLNPTGSGASSTKIQIDKVKLEIVEDGDLTPTEFVPKPLNEEILDCSRFFVRLTPPNTTAFGPSYSQTTNLIRTSIPLPVTMRACPTVTKTSTMYAVGISNQDGTVSSIPITSVSGVGSAGSPHGFSNHVAVNLHHSSGNGNQGCTYFYSGYVDFDAEI